MIKTSEGRIRKLTPHECSNLQGLPKGYKLPTISDSHLYKQAGNSVVVPVVARIAQNINKII
ncbi:MAG: DNA cytosine methyltransferase [Youngiibacter sp.]|nr:DNA cytosine methyltransferase [Youngiibacter sp.]